MTEFHNVGESIECAKCEIVTRKFVPSSPQIHEVLGRVIKYELSLNCSAEIIEEVDPKEWKIDFASKLSLGDKLKAKSIYALVSSIKRVKWDVINFTATHKAQKAEIGYFTFAKIKSPLDNVLNSMHKRKELNK